MTSTIGKIPSSVTIANGATVSDSHYFGDEVLSGIVTPASMTGTTLTFQVSDDNTTFFTLYDSTNVAISVTISSSRAYALNPLDFIGWQYMKIVSGTAETGAKIITIEKTKVLNLSR